MTLEEFKKSTETESEPTVEMNKALQSLWWDKKGDWAKSHNIVQDIHDSYGSWIHAYLHRKEGDDLNAKYWYEKAGRPYPTVNLIEEWDLITQNLL